MQQILYEVLLKTLSLVLAGDCYYQVAPLYGLSLRGLELAKRLCQTSEQMPNAEKAVVFLLPSQRVLIVVGADAKLLSPQQ